MSDRLVFVSCGQQSPLEKSMGALAKGVVDSTQGYKAYFAEYVQSLDSLASSIFSGLATCCGMIVFLHERGRVIGPDGHESGIRSSVWVNQEIAILAYRKHFEAAEIPILAFQDSVVKLEGAMTSLIVNPKPIGTTAIVEAEIRSWLTRLSDLPGPAADRSRFESKWSKLSHESILVLTALLDEGAINVKEASIRICLTEKYGIDRDHAGKIVADSRSVFQTTDLVKLVPNIHSGDEMSINPVWRWEISRRIRSRSATKQN